MLTGTAGWLLILPMLAIGMAIGAALALRTERTCPSCSTPLETLAEASSVQAYSVLVCHDCRNAVTLVHGRRFRFATCPACLQRSLETPSLRLPDQDGRLIVEVHEQCTGCGFHATTRVEGEAPPRGLVVPFPGERQQKSGTGD